MEKIEITIKAILIIFVIAFIIGFPTIAFCSSETYANRVTIEVPSYLFIDCNQKDLNLSFSDYHTGSETNSQSVTYTVLANSMAQSEGAPALTAKLDGTFPNIDFRASVGSYSKQGGDTELGAASSDFISINDEETTLAKKMNSTGDGKLLRGQVEVTYKGVAKKTLSAGQYSQYLIITLTDI